MRTTAMTEARSDDAKSGADLLLDVGRRLFLTHGYAAVTMQQIATEAGMTKGAPYYHFESKEDLFLAVSRQILQTLSDDLMSALSMELPFADRLREAIVAVVGSTSGDLSIWFGDFKQLMAPEKHATLFRDMIGVGDLALLVQPRFEEAVQSGDICGVSPDVAARAYVTLLLGSIDVGSFRKHLGYTDQQEFVAQTDDLVQIFVRGLKLT